MKNFSETANFIWSIADLLRGDYKQSDYGKVILPFTVLRRLDCVLADTKEVVLKKGALLQTMEIDNIDPVLNQTAKQKFHNRSLYDFDKLIADPDNIAANLRNYINGFSTDAREILAQFDFENQISKLEDSNLLFLVLKRFQSIDLHPTTISSMEMGYMFEELIRKFSELSNETAGEHFTPREVIRLMVNILFLNDKGILTQKGIVKTMFDCCAGTGGMLSVAEEYLNELNPDARLEVFGQELNSESYAICKSDMLIKGQNASNIKQGNSLRRDGDAKQNGDGFVHQKFDYLITNPPFGVKWKKVEKEVKAEHESMGFGGRFGPGLPSVSDGSLLFLMNLISKMKQDGDGSRLAIVFNGSPLFSGKPSSKQNESSIRQWIIENDLLEAVIALPNQLFYNTGISTYIWVLNNRKSSERKGKVQLINAMDFYKKMSKSLGNKRNELSEQHIIDITKLYGDFAATKYCKIFDNKDFGYYKVTVERPARDAAGKVIKDKKGNPKADSKLRDSETIPLSQDIDAYMKKEVLPHVPDAWVDEKKTLVGYEINFTKYFYEYKPLRPLQEITKDLIALEAECDGLLQSIINR